VIVPRRLKQKKLSHTVGLERRIKQNPANGLCDRRTPGLARDDDLSTLVPKPLGQSLHLGTLARALTTLERDQYTV
jgi:hypothetical protein